VKNLIKKAISSFGFKLQRKSMEKIPAMDILDFLRESSSPSEVADFLRYAVLNAQRSYSQLFQDLFVLNTLSQKRGGYFVEFGAADGIFLSNTFLLERDYGWNGIVAEPSLNWHASLSKNRHCAIDLRCVWSGSGETLTFSETKDPEFSTITQFKYSDLNEKYRSKSKEYNVITISLNDLLDEYKAPSDMDYLSIDTEGSELLVLKSFDFRKSSFKIITVEHNHIPSYRDAIHSLLSSKGYRRVLSDITRWDDWYLRTD
jgi:FkbM family methyltransferase